MGGGVRTSCGSRMLGQFRRTLRCHAARRSQRLKAAGAVMLGKANMDEVRTWDPRTETSYYGPRQESMVTLQRSPVGSSARICRAPLAARLASFTNREPTPAVRFGQPAASDGGVGTGFKPHLWPRFVGVRHDRLCVQPSAQAGVFAPHRRRTRQGGAEDHRRLRPAGLDQRR